MIPVPRGRYRSRYQSARPLVPVALLAFGLSSLAPTTASTPAGPPVPPLGHPPTAEPQASGGLIANIFDQDGHLSGIHTAVDGSLSAFADQLGTTFTAAGVLTTPPGDTELRTTGGVCLTVGEVEHCDGKPAKAVSGPLALSGEVGTDTRLEWRDAADPEWRPVPLGVLSTHDLNHAEHDAVGTIGIATASCESGDEDCDGIPGAWEENGYTVERAPGQGGVALVPWDDARHDASQQPRFVSSPLKASTNGDPFTDFQKATGLQLDPRVSPEARNPLVAAAPEVEAVMTGFELIPNTAWSSETGGDRSQSITQTTDRRTDWSNTVGGSAECGVGTGRRAPSALKFECKVSVNYSHTWGGSVGYSASDTNASTERWNSLISGSNAQAALLLPSVYYENTGTAPVVNAYPQFTISLGEDALMSASTVDGNKLAAANPGARYPERGQLAFWQVKDFRDPIFVSQSVVNRLQDYYANVEDVLKVRVDGYDAKVALIDEHGQPIESSRTWAQQNSLIDASTAAITVTERDGSVRRKIAAPGTGVIEGSIPSSTLGEALVLAFDATRDGDTYRIGEKLVTPENYELISDPATRDRITAQNLTSIFDLELTADMQLTLHAKQTTADIAGFDRFHATLTPGFLEQDCTQSGCWVLIKPANAPNGPLRASVDNGAPVELVEWPLKPGVFAIHGSYLSKYYPGNMRGRSIIVWDGDTKLGAVSLPKLQLHDDIDFGR